MREAIILIGGGGHCKACIDVIEAEGRFSIAGIIDVPEKKGAHVSGYEVIACDADLPLLTKSFRHFLVAVGQVRSADKRRSLFAALKECGAHLPSIVSPRAYVSRSAVLGEGTIVMHGAVVNAGVRIGRNCIINTSAIIEHDTIIEDHCHISTRSVVNGECSVGEGVFIGSGSVISNNIAVAKDTVIGAGAVVVTSIETPDTYVGVPARSRR